MEQMNGIIEAINYASDSYWGNPERYQFRARIDNFATPVNVEQKGERSVKATFSLRLYGYLVPDVVQKQLNSIKKFKLKVALTDLSPFCSTFTGVAKLSILALN
jgi:hypothetical protein